MLNGGSTALETAMLGKPVICLGPSKYQKAGFSHHVNGPEEWGALSGDLISQHDQRESIRLALRFLYVQQRRFPQYVNHVRALSTTRFEYFDGADAARLIALLQSGAVVPDDVTVAQNDAEESVVVDRVLNQDWDALAAYDEVWPELPPLKIERRFGLRWIDNFREKLPRGDVS